MQHSRPDQAPAGLSAEEDAFLKSQLITYIGNKRALLGLIDAAFAQTCQRHALARPHMLDLFAGSGVVSRLMKLRAASVWANDLEAYSSVVNRCFLTNPSAFDAEVLADHARRIGAAAEERAVTAGFVRRLYAPQDPDRIRPEDRVFYTVENAEIIDSCAPLILALPQPYRDLLMGPFLSACSKHVNTSGVFKGFYKNKQGVGQYGGTMRNALTRILKRIEIELPVLVERDCAARTSAMLAEELVEDMDEVDIAYFDPPYNQHPYGSNYFMLNAIAAYAEPQEISRVSGIPTDWNRSTFNKRPTAMESMEHCVAQVKAKSVIVSYNSEGFIAPEDMEDMLARYGDLHVMSTDYPTFRGCRNLHGRDKAVTEFIYLLEKR